MKAILLAMLVISAPAHAGQILSGRASVIDGDTIEIAGARIRLNGVDAPESRQTCTNAAGAAYRCGKESAFALDSFLAASRPTTCEVLGHDRYGRAIGDCYRNDGEPVSAWLVRHGLAIDWVKYSRGAFAKEQDAARAARLGIWAGKFEMPCVFRAHGGKPRC